MNAIGIADDSMSARHADAAGAARGGNKRPVVLPVATMAVRETIGSPQRLQRGDPHTAEALLPLVYDELRNLAAAKMAREPPGLTLQPTALVHEAWLRLGADRQPSWGDRAHFFAAAAEAMRRILIDGARRRRAHRHGGDWQKCSPEEPSVVVAAPVADDELLLLHDALDALAREDARLAELVKLRYFVGLTTEETAGVMGISERTVKRNWAYARAWLRYEMQHPRS